MGAAGEDEGCGDSPGTGEAVAAAEVVGFGSAVVETGEAVGFGSAGFSEFGVAVVVTVAAGVVGLADDSASVERRDLVCVLPCEVGFGFVFVERDFVD